MTAHHKSPQVQNAGRLRFPPDLATAVTVLLLFALAFFLRVYLLQDYVFVGDQVRFVGADAHYHMRLVDSLVHNFPRYLTFDPYLYYPYGSSWQYMPFLDWLVAGNALLLGLGHPTMHTIEVVGAYTPAVLGALTVVPVFFIGKEVFSRRAGLLSAALIAVLPGEFMGRSVLGATDHHVAEVLFSTVAMLFLIRAVKSARQKRLALTDFRNLNWPVIRRPLTNSLLAGLFLGVYLLSWVGGPLVVLIIFVYFVAQAVADHLRGTSTDYLWLAGTPAMLVTTLMLLPLSPSGLPLLAVLATLAVPLVLNGISRLFNRGGIRQAYYPVAVLGLGVAGMAALRFANPVFFASALDTFRIFRPTGVGLTISEVNPLLSVGDEFSFSLAWEMFTTGFFISFVSLGILIYGVFRREETSIILLLVWSLVMLAATLGERRFAYYYAVNVALLTGYFASRFLDWVDVGRLVAQNGRAGEAARSVSPAAARVVTVLGMVIVLFVVYVPSTGLPPRWSGPTTDVIIEARALIPSDGWYNSLVWLRKNTPDPFGDPDFYYQIYEAPPPGKSYQYPEDAYGVMAWWDYGHWITRIARRLPNHGPGGNWSVPVARCLTTQEEDLAIEVFDRLDSSYAVIDYDTATRKFHAVVTFAGGDPDDYRGIYHIEDEGKLLPIVLFYPEYFRSLSSRLYNFEGRAVVPESTMVISYENAVDGAGTPYRRITSARSFPTYEEANAYLSDRDPDRYRIVSPDPMVTPVPLEPLQHFQLVHSSEQRTEHLGGEQIPSVKVFQYLGADGGTVKARSGE